MCFSRAIFTIRHSGLLDCLLVMILLLGVLLLFFLHHRMASYAGLGLQWGTGPMLTALVFGNGQQTCLGRMTGEIGWRQCQHGWASGTTLNLAILAVTMLLAALMGQGREVNEMRLVDESKLEQLTRQIRRNG